MSPVRVGVLGKRGLACVPGIRSVPGAEVAAFCDLDPSTAKLASDIGIDSFHPKFDDLLNEVDAVVVATPMQFHASQCIEALKKGKHVLSEVTAAVTVDECIALKKAAATAKASYSFAENYCYFKECLIARQLAHEGRFGQLYFGEGNYVHEVRFLHADPKGQATWRKQWQVGARGNTYCTHELGPLMQWFRAADPSIKILSVACFGTGAHTDPTLHHDDCSLTLVKLSNGGLLKLQLDMVSNRPHRIGYCVQGTLGVMESDDRYRIWLGSNVTVKFGDEERRWADVFEYESALPSQLRTELSLAANEGHGGGDFFVGRRFGQSIVEGVPPEIGVNEAVEWTMVGLLSQKSILSGGTSVKMPGFVYARP